MGRDGCSADAAMVGRPMCSMESRNSPITYFRRRRGGERAIDEVARIYSWPITFYWCTADRGDFVCATKWLRGICHRSFMTHRAEPVCRSLRRTRRSRDVSPSLFLAPRTSETIHLNRFLLVRFSVLPSVLSFYAFFFLFLFFFLSRRHVPLYIKRFQWRKFLLWSNRLNVFYVRDICMSLSLRSDWL